MALLTSLTLITSWFGAMGASAFDDGTSTGAVTLRSVDGDGVPLPGAGFAVTTAEGQHVTTVADGSAADGDPAPGVVVVGELAPGSYGVSMTSAPEGYQPPAETQWVSVTDGAVEGSATATFVSQPVADEPVPAEEPVAEEEPVVDEPADTRDPVPAEEPTTSEEESATEETPARTAADSAGTEAGTSASVQGDAPDNHGDPEPAPAPLPNPWLPQTCGIDVAVVIDMSSAQHNIDRNNSFHAARDYLHLLRGTPSSAGVYTFASFAPDGTNAPLAKTSLSTQAGFVETRQRINTLARVPDGVGGANWDAGLSQVPVGEYDLIIFFTGSQPTAYGTPGSAGNDDHGTSADPVDLHRAIASANAHKAAGTAVVALGVGDAHVDSMRAVSGPVAGSDYYFFSGYEQLGSRLSGLAVEGCGQQVPGLDPDVTMTADPGYAVEHTWSIDRSASRNLVKYAEGDRAPAVRHTVTVSPEERVETGWTVQGTVEIDNPNQASFPAELTGAVDNGGTCNLDDGAEVTVEPGLNTFGYTCTYESRPTTPDGSSAATLTWDPAVVPGTTGSASASEPFDFGDATPYPVLNETVQVEDDDAPGSPWTVTWPADGTTPTTVTYWDRATGEPGRCTEVSNEATIVQTGQSDGTTVRVCVGSDLEVTKNVVLDLERTYLWSLDAEADETSVTVDPDTGEATFDHTVTITPTGSEDAGWRMRGEITVTNPNHWQDIRARVVDRVSVDAASCEVDGGDGYVRVRAGRSVTVPYVCTVTEVTPEEYDGRNTAVVTWDREKATTPSGRADARAYFDAEDWSITPVNRTVTVYDDKADPDHPVRLGKATWNAKGEPRHFTYSVTRQGVPGGCRTFTSTAWIAETGQQATERVQACGEVDLSVDLTADATFDRQHHWKIAKSADADRLTVDPQTGVAQVGYEVVVGAGHPAVTDSGHALSGEVQVTNHLGYGDPVVVDVSAAPHVGTDATCTVVDGEGVSIPAGESRTLRYECDLLAGEVPTDGTATAVAAWNGGSAKATEDVSFVPGAVSDDVVTVVDDPATAGGLPLVLGMLDVHEDELPATFSYSLDLPGEPGECITHHNTATIVETGQSAGATVSLCWYDQLTVARTVDATFVRNYAWDLQKVADEPVLMVDERAGEGVFDYTVSATPQDYADFGWAMSGDITVGNPNQFTDITVDVTDVVGIEGVSCEIDGGGAGVVVPAAGSVTLAYECEIAESGPASYEGTSTATVVWDDGQGSGEVHATVPVEFVEDEAAAVDAVVQVSDDLADPEAEPVVLGEAVWDAEGTPQAFGYSVTQAGEPGRCAEMVNTAWLDDDEGTQAVEEVTLCVAADQPVTPVVPAPPAPPTPPVPPAQPPAVTPVIPTGAPTGSGADTGRLAAGVALLALAVLTARGLGRWRLRVPRSGA